jgi:lipoate-protein ligase A
VPSVWLLSVDRPALVLGSTQAETVVNRRAAAGVEIVRRHSGGGAVLLTPGSVLWADVLVAAGDPLWTDDVGRAFWWLGEVWVEALASAGVEGARWHDGPLERTPLSDLVCFAGLGPGEVVTGDGRKVVGMSQRRTRSGALFQCAALLAWDAAATAALLGLDATELADAATGVGVALGVLQEAFVAALARR